MKTLIALLAFSVSASAFAAKPVSAVKQCAFGESTADLSEMLDYEGKGKVWYKTEEISITRPERIKGLTKFERELIFMAKGVADNKAEQKEALEDFAGSDGYLTYFSHNSNDRQFVQVGSYPGDNEFGAIIEIKGNSFRNDYEIVNFAAIISDGDLEDCQVEKE